MLQFKIFSGVLVRAQASEILAIFQNSIHSLQMPTKELWKDLKIYNTQ